MRVWTKLGVVTLLLAGSTATAQPGRKGARNVEAVRAEARAQRGEVQARRGEARAERNEAANAAREAREARAEIRENRQEVRAQVRQRLRDGDIAGAREARREMVQENRELRASAMEARTEARAERREAAQASRRAARASRRATRWRRLARRMRRDPSSHRAIDAQTTAELRTHARRIARLDRMEALAKQSEAESLLERISAARARETARHERRLERIAGHPLAEPEDAAEEPTDTTEANGNEPQTEEDAQ